MQVKRFVAANMRLALKMVREEMGPDAVILSNKRSGEGVELLIALESVPQFADNEISRQSATPTAQQVAYSDNPFRSSNTDSLAAETTVAASHLELEVNACSVKQSSGLDRWHRCCRKKATASVRPGWILTGYQRARSRRACRMM